MQQPSAPDPQQTVSRVRSELSAALAATPSNVFSPAWRHALEELGVDALLGVRLRDTLEDIFNRNQITPSTALEEVQGLSEAVQALETNAQQILDGFEALDIAADHLQPGEFEVGVLIPRGAVQGQLAPLGREFVALDRLLQPFEELVTGTRPPFLVRSISASEFGAFVEAAPPVAAFLAVSVERVVALYKQLLEIRKLKSELDSQNVPAEALAPLESHANQLMEAGIKTAVEELVAEYATRHDAGRLNELKIELSLSLNGIANRIDSGYNFEVRVAPLPPAEDDEGEEESDRPTDLQAQVEVVLERSEALQFINAAGAPILSLQESRPEDRPASSRD